LVDLTHWFCWITVAGAVMGLLAAVQQLMIHGLRPFVRAVLVTIAIGSALAIAYPYVQVRPVGAGPQNVLAAGAAPATPTPVQPAPLNLAPLGPAAVCPTPARAESNLVESSVPESVPASVTPLGPTTADSAFKPVEAPPPGAASVAVAPIAPPPLPPSAAKNRTPVPPGTVQAERPQIAGLKPILPALLAAEQRLFSPSEVAYCPACFSAYSSKGPTVGVRCVHCAATVNLVSNQDYMVHRCSKCGKLRRTTHFPPAIGPYVFRYYCSFCKEYHWFVN
jgi:hypothetical protein